MRVLIIGYSEIVKKRVLPALEKMKCVDCIDIASRSFTSCIPEKKSRQGAFFADYDEALSKSKADLVYISLVNSKHAEWAERALAKGCHVIVDKPSFTSFDDAKKLANLAEQKGLCLAEATVYAWHPQLQMARDLFMQADTRPTRLTVAFSFPPLPAGNFRYQKSLGGGALWDLGPYAVSPGRLFFEAEPEEVFCGIGTRHSDTGVDTSFSMLAMYAGGRSLVGHFDFNTEYRNCINILGPNMSVDIDRFFTTPPDMESELAIHSSNKACIIKAPRADSFALFFHSVFEAISNNTHLTFNQNLLSDATQLCRLRNAAHEE